MRSLKTILALVLFVLVAATFIFSDDSKVRVTASKANIRLRPTTQSPIVSAVPLGAVLEVIKKEGNWYFVKLPPDEKGIVVTGYIHRSIVEVVEEIEQPVEPEEKNVEKRETIIPEEKPQEVVPEPKESQKDFSKDPDYSRWKEEYFRAEKQLDQGAKYQTMGLITMIAGPTAIAIGVATKISILDVIGAAAGSAGIGLYVYGFSKKNRAEEKLNELKREGKIKKYIMAYINPEKKCYAVTLVLNF